MMEAHNFCRDSERNKHIIVKKPPQDTGNKDKSGAVKCPQCDRVFYKQSTMEIHLVSQISCFPRINVMCTGFS